MARKSLIVGFSLPPEIYRELENFMKKSHKTRSELMREMINVYFNSLEKSTPASRAEPLNLTDEDLNKVLKIYYKLLGQSVTKKVLVIALAIIDKDGKVLIGARKDPDPYVKDLTWVFPGGKMDSLDFEQELKEEVSQETGLGVEVRQLVHARLIPDSPEKKVRIVALYFHCELVKGSPRPGGDLKELLWVPARSVCRHFTTSTADEVMRFLGTL